VVEEYERLIAEDITLPGYVLEAAAGAMLNQRRPEEALQLYNKALELNPKSYHARTGIFFALVETENFSDALCLIDKAVNDQPKWLYPGGTRVPRSNWRRQAVETYAALGRFFGDDLAEAERRFTLMTNEAPANPDLLRELGTIYLSRGWPRRSQNTLQLGLALSPDHRGLRTGYAESHLSFRQYRDAETEIAALFAEYPENTLVQRLDRAWRVHNMRELRVDTTIRSGNGNIYGDQEWEVSTKVFSRPVNYNYRIFAGYSHSQAGFLEGDGFLNSYSIGLEYSSPALEATIGAGFNDSTSNHAGLWADGLWHLNDYWSIPFGIEKYSRETPLRAIHNKRRANAIKLGVNYRANEGREIALDGEFMDFTDGNRRSRVTLSGTQRILTLSRHKIKAFGEISASNNSRLGGPYFNPDSDLGITGGLEHLWRIYRRYNKSFHQKMRVSGGNYKQEGYGSSYIMGLEYTFIIELNNRFDITYGAGRNRSVYDGKPEWSNFASMSLNWRF
jgi:biofilm PGA synthesis protein PgaA